MNIQPFGNLDDSRLRRFEADFGLELPADYRRFLLQNNGGTGHRVRVWLEELERWVAVDSFFGLELKPALDLRAWAEEFEGELPPGALVIGSDPFGALLVLQTGEEDRVSDAGSLGSISAGGLGTDEMGGLSGPAKPGLAAGRPGIYLYDHAHQLEGSGDVRNAYLLTDSWTELDEAMAEPLKSAGGNPRAAKDAGDHRTEDQAFSKKPATASFWVPGGIDRAKTSGKANLQVVDRLMQARFTHQGAFAASDGARALIKATE